MRIRTADPLHAMQVLYQLSYGPSIELNIAGWWLKKSSKTTRKILMLPIAGRLMT